MYNLQPNVQSGDLPMIFSQALGGELRGECRDYEAVPGHGLRCTVWGVDQYSKSDTWGDTTPLKRLIVVQSTSSLLPQQSEGASPPKSYEVLSGVVIIILSRALGYP